MTNEEQVLSAKILADMRSAIRALGVLEYDDADTVDAIIEAVLTVWRHSDARKAA